jgi:hypothetical protein
MFSHCRLGCNRISYAPTREKWVNTKQRVEMPRRRITSTPGQELNTSAQEASLLHYSAFQLHDTWHVSSELRIIFTVLKNYWLYRLTMTLQSSKGTFCSVQFSNYYHKCIWAVKILPTFSRCFFYNAHKACVRACVKAFGVIVLHGIASRKNTIFTSYRAENFKILNKKHAKKLLPVFELACVVHQTYFPIGTAHTDNW